MAKQTIIIGAVAGDGTGDPLRTAMDKANQNFTELYTDVAAAQTDITTLEGDVLNKIDLDQKGANDGVATLDSGGKIPAGQLPTLTKTDVGLANVDNTSDANKPVSTAQQTALDLKANLAGGNTFAGDQTFSGDAYFNGSSGVSSNGGGSWGYYIANGTGGGAYGIGNGTVEVASITGTNAGLMTIDFETSLTLRDYSSLTPLATFNGSGGLTLTGDLVIPDEVYGVGWDASLEAPTKNAVYDKIEAVVASVAGKKALNASFTTDATTAYTLVLGDAGKHVELTNAAAITLTVPTNASVAYPVGTEITIEQGGAGVVTLTPDSGVTINSLLGNLDTAGQYAVVKLVKKAADIWLAYGDLA